MAKMEFLEALVLVAVAAWVADAFVTAWLADERGRNPLPWLALSLLVSPLALLAVGFAPRVAGHQFNVCVECEEAVPRKATTCPFCLTDLINAEAEEKAAR